MFSLLVSRSPSASSCGLFASRRFFSVLSRSAANNNIPSDNNNNNNNNKGNGNKSGKKSEPLVYNRPPNFGDGFNRNRNFNNRNTAAGGARGAAAAGGDADGSTMDIFRRGGGRPPRGAITPELKAALLNTFDIKEDDGFVAGPGRPPHGNKPRREGGGGGGPRGPYTPAGGYRRPPFDQNKRVDTSNVSRIPINDIKGLVEPISKPDIEVEYSESQLEALDREIELEADGAHRKSRHGRKMHREQDMYSGQHHQQQATRKLVGRRRGRNRRDEDDDDEMLRAQESFGSIDTGNTPKLITWMKTRMQSIDPKHPYYAVREQFLQELQKDFSENYSVNNRLFDSQPFWNNSSERIFHEYDLKLRHHAEDENVDYWTAMTTKDNYSVSHLSASAWQQQAANVMDTQFNVQNEYVDKEVAEFQHHESIIFKFHLKDFKKDDKEFWEMYEMINAPDNENENLMFLRSRKLIGKEMNDILNTLPRDSEVRLMLQKMVVAIQSNAFLPSDERLRIIREMRDNFEKVRKETGGILISDKIIEEVEVKEEFDLEAARAADFDPSVDADDFSFEIPSNPTAKQ